MSIDFCCAVMQVHTARRMYVPCSKTHTTSWRRHWGSRYSKIARSSRHPPRSARGGYIATAAQRGRLKQVRSRERISGIFRLPYVCVLLFLNTV